MKTLRKLLEVAGPSINPAASDPRRLAEAIGGDAAAVLWPLLERKNGLYAFEGALHVLSAAGTALEKSLVDWNAESLWRRDYDGMADGAVHFAEDVFGTQFCVRDRSISTFDPETGAFEAMASDLDEWADKILEDYGVWTGYPLAHEWQVLHGPIPLGARLVPVTPFVLGGDYTVENVHAVEAARGMRLRASVAVQIRDLPDGAKVVLKTVD
jgi:hypothetical protein